MYGCICGQCIVHAQWLITTSNWYKIADKIDKCSFRGKWQTCLRSASGDVTRIERSIANVVSVEEVRDETLQAETVAPVGSSAKESLVRVPVVLGRVNVLALEALHQFLVVPNPHRTADNFPNTRQKNVNLANK